MHMVNFFGYLQDVWGLSEVKMFFAMALSYACHPLSNSTCSGFLLESRSVVIFLHPAWPVSGAISGLRLGAVSCIRSMGGEPVEILHSNDEKFSAVQCHGSSSSRWRYQNLCLPVTTPLSESPLVKQHIPQLRTHSLECSSGSGAPISEPMSQEKSLDIGFSHLEKNLSSTLRIANVGKFTKSAKNHGISAVLLPADGIDQELGQMAPWNPSCNLGCICITAFVHLYIFSPIKSV